MNFNLERSQADCILNEPELQIREGLQDNSKITGFQIRRGNRDNLQIIFLIFSLKHTL